MEITRTGKYRLVRDFIDRGPACVGTIPCGTVIDITQIDLRTNKVIGPQLADWNYNNLPVEPVGEPKFQAVYCSQCGGDFGPGDSGFSHCKDHQNLTARD